MEPLVGLIRLAGWTVHLELLKDHGEPVRLPDSGILVSCRGGRCTRAHAAVAGRSEFGARAQAVALENSRSSDASAPEQNEG
ncbi:hypothetical protein, partial [Micromonospora radicis]|uniref:hypothetical protein n=1 Tax=Micromonospora radicis TaxID=1894971 RepID=UPI001F414B2C